MAAGSSSFEYVCQETFLPSEVISPSPERLTAAFDQLHRGPQIFQDDSYFGGLLFAVGNSSLFHI